MASQYSDPYEEWKAQGRPGGSFQAWQASQGGSTPTPTPLVTGTPVSTPVPLATGIDPNALTIDALRQRAASTGASEDWTRFQQGDVQRWQPFYDAASGRFRSSRGAEGLFDKPTECPPGMGPSGPNETDPCTSQGYGGGDVQSGVTSSAAPAAASSPLATVLTGLQAQKPEFGRETGFGGVRLPMMTTSPVNQPSGGFRDVTTNASSGLSSLLAPLQGANAGFMAPTTAQSGLTDMLRRRQATRPGGWF